MDLGIRGHQFLHELPVVARRLPLNTNSTRLQQQTATGYLKAIKVEFFRNLDI